MNSLETQPWWDYLGEDLQELLLQSQILLKLVEKWGGGLPDDRQEFHDYAFVVFPSAKAYEGFLKRLFLDLGLISEKQYFGKRFRVGKALNPALDKNLREKFGVYYKLVEFCQDSELADVLWETWRQCRNLLFHWFPKEKNAISFDEAREKISMILDAMDKAFKECKIDKLDIK